MGDASVSRDPSEQDQTDHFYQIQIQTMQVLEVETQQIQERAAEDSAQAELTISRMI